MKYICYGDRSISSASKLVYLRLMTFFSCFYSLYPQCLQKHHLVSTPLPQCGHFLPDACWLRLDIRFWYWSDFPQWSISRTRTALKGWLWAAMAYTCKALFHKPSFRMLSYWSACLAHSSIFTSDVIDFGPPESLAITLATTSGEVTILAARSHDNSLLRCQ